MPHLVKFKTQQLVHDGSFTSNQGLQRKHSRVKNLHLNNIQLLDKLPG